MIKTARIVGVLVVLLQAMCVGGQGDLVNSGPRKQIGLHDDLVTIEGWYAEVERANGAIERINSGDILGLQVGQRAKIYATVKNADTGWHRVAVELCADNGRAIGLLMPSAADEEDPIYENCLDVRNEIEGDSWYQLWNGETEDYPAGDALAMRPGGGSLYLLLEVPDREDPNYFYELERMAVEYDIAPDNSN